jgi:hypothetical protein
VAGNRVSIQTLIPLLSEDTGRTDLNDKIDLIAEFALEAERKIGTRKWLDEIKPATDGLPTAKINIINYRGMLPKDYYDADDIQSWSTNLPCSCGLDICTCSTCGCGTNMTNAWSTPCGCGAWNYYYMGRCDEFRIQGCYLTAPFRTGVAQIHYYAIPLDEEGYPEIMQSHRDAIQAYSLWRLNMANWITRKIDHTTIQMLEMRWKELCAQARGVDNLPDRQQMAQAATLNNDPYKHRKMIGGYWGGLW